MSVEASQPPLPPPRRRRWRVVLAVLLGAGLASALAVMGGFWAVVVRMPGHSYRGSFPALTPEQAKLAEELRRDVQVLAEQIGPRHVGAYPKLARAADYVEAQLRDAGCTVERQGYAVDDLTCHNVIAEVKGREPKGRPIVIVGAHYDSVARSPAANDNASGVAAMLALARRVTNQRLPGTVRFVGFVNEEAPFGLSPRMGSWVYAQRCRERNENVVMLSLETMGYYTDEPESQRYPLPSIGYLYPATGNFVAFVGNIRSGALVRQVVGSFRRHAAFPSEGAALPESIRQAGWSDHWSFWEHRYPALMVTDTAMFRYRHYHRAQDTPEKLSYEAMARVTQGLEQVIVDLAGGR